MRRSLRYALLLLAAVIASAGCQRIPLYDLSTDIRLIINHDIGIDHDIELSSETDLPEEYEAKINGKMPQYVNVLFYDPKTHNLLTSHILDAEGGVISIPTGNYDIVIYNFGTESTQIANSDHRHHAEAHTSDITKTMEEKFKAIQASVSPGTRGTSKGYEDDPIIYEPDHLYVANLAGVEIPSFQDQTEDVVIQMNSSTIIDTYSLEVINITGAENIEKVEAFITGQIKSNYFGKQVRSETPATIYTDMRVDVPGDRLYSIFNTFGKLPGEENKIYLDITVTDSGGGQYRYIYDVTDQFDDDENINHKLIIDGNEIDIPTATSGGAGFAPSVDEWENETIDVPLG